MRILVVLVVLVAACDVFRAGDPKTELTQQQFVEVYVELARSNTPSARQAILKKHKTTEKALQDFVQAYSGDVRQLSTAFDSALARLAAPSSGQLPPVQPN